GRSEAGRRPSDVEILFTARSSLNEDRDTAIDNVKASVSSILNHSMRFGLEGKHVPEDLRAKIEAYLDHYVLYDHVLHEGQNPKRMEALGLTPYALERFALAGNARDWIERIEQVAALGASRLWIHLKDSIHQIDDPVIGNAGPGVDVFLYVPDRGPGWTH